MFMPVTAKGVSVIYVLIIIIGGYSGQSGYATVVSEFNTLDACEAAKKQVVASVQPSPTIFDVARVRAQGCHPKGLRQ